MTATQTAADTWWAVTLQVPQAWAEDASASLIAAGALGVEELPRGAAAPVGQVKLLASFDAAADGAGLAALAATAVAELGLRLDAAHVGVARRQGRPWAEAWKQHFKPLKIGRRMWVVPSWERTRFAPPTGGVVLELDPGMAFGTGQHATTALCLRAIEGWADARDGAARSAARMLDLGCGTGILAIGAGRLGVGDIVAADLDPEAVADARRNAALNGVHLEATATAVDALPGEFDLIVANILAAPLIALAPALLARLRAGGTLLLSGILTAQSEGVILAYGRAAAAASLPLALQARHTHAEWTALDFVRGAAPHART